MVRRDDPALILPDVGQLPDAVDIADRPQALARAQARIYGDPAVVGFDANGLQAEPIDARTPAGRDQQPVATQFPAVVEFQGVVLALAPRGGRVHAEGKLDAVPAQGLGECPPRGWGSRGSNCAVPSTRTTSPPRRRTACAISTPTGPPPSTSSRRGTAFMPGTSRFVQTPSKPRRPGTGGDWLKTRRHDHVSGRVANTVDVDHARPGQPAATAKQVDAMLGEPTFLASVGVVRNHVVAPGKGPHRRRLVLSPPRRSRRARPPPGAAASWTGCTPSRSTRHRPARARRVRRADRPLRARPRSARPASRRQ
jgi:hypothetical protein